MPSYLILAIVLFASGGGSGFFIASKIGAANLAQCELDKEKMLAEQAQESSERMQTAAKSADKAMVYAMNRIIGAEQQAGKLKNELKKHTTGRDCLSAGARRVLESGAAFDKQRMPEGAKGVDPTAAGAAANTGDGSDTAASTDTDIAGWISAAAALYEQCRARIDGIKQWDAEANAID